MSVKFVYFTIKFCFVSLPTIINSHAKSTTISQLKLKGNRSDTIVISLIRVLDLVQRQSFLFVYLFFLWLNLSKLHIHTQMNEYIFQVNVFFDGNILI